VKKYVEDDLHKHICGQEKPTLVCTIPGAADEAAAKTFKLQSAIKLTASRLSRRFLNERPPPLM